MGLPDPPDVDEIRANNDLIVVTETDSDESNSYEGYEQLPTAPDDNDCIIDDNEQNITLNESIGNNSPSTSNLIDDNLINHDVWSSSKSVDITMDNDKVNQVKEAMLDFKLPSNHIPEWAKNIPEAEWKERLLNKIQNN